MNKDSFMVREYILYQVGVRAGCQSDFMADPCEFLVNQFVIDIDFTT